MFVVIYQNKDVCQDEAGNTIFHSYEDALELVEWLTYEGFDCQDYKIARITFLD